VGRVRVKGRRNVMEKCEGREFVMIYFVLFSMNDVYDLRLWLFFSLSFYLSHPRIASFCPRSDIFGIGNLV
jgi:hypothetical protein